MMHPKRPFQLLVTLTIIAGFVLPGCRKSEEAAQGASFLSQTGISYGSDPLQALDLFLPARRTEKTPVAILIHGGGWVSGTKEDMNGYASHLALSGIAALSMNYRLAGPTVSLSKMLDDIESVIHYYYSHASSWGLGSRRPMLFGYSAGGHLALMYAYTRDHAALTGGVISLAGPTDLRDTLLWRSGSLYQDICLMTGDTIPGNWKPFSPVCYAGNTDFPLLLIHGENDDLVPVSQAYSLAEGLSQPHRPLHLLLLENETHYYSAEANKAIEEAARLFMTSIPGPER